MNIAKIIFNELFKGKKGGIYIECGAIDGKKNNHCYHLMNKYDWTGYNFEPNKYSFVKLEENRSMDTNINFALSNEDGIAEFNLPIGIGGTKINGGGSLKDNRTDIDEIFEVNTMKFSTFIEEYNVDYIDIMILDVEGNELEVLEGFRGSKVLPKAISIEVNKIDNEVVNEIMEEFQYRQSNINVGKDNKVYTR
jgi:FkbM family methyltransferase